MQSQNTESNNLLSRSFQGIWIPRQIWLNPKLSIQAKCLWAEIQSLHDDERGGCYASQAYLCEFLGVKERMLRNHLAALKQEGLIEEVSSNGRGKVLRAIDPREVSAGQSGNKMPKRAAKSCQSERQNVAAPPYIDTREDTSKEREGDTPQSPPPNQGRVAPKKVERELHVHTTEEEHAKLCEGRTEEQVAQAYRRLSEWKQDTARSKWKKSDYRSILRWVFDALKEPRVSSGRGKSRANPNVSAEQKKVYDELF